MARSPTAAPTWPRRRRGAHRRRLLRAAGLDGALLAPAPAIPWVIAGLRPAAHPVRRIAALARLVARHGGADLDTGIRRALADAHAAGPRALVTALLVRGEDDAALCGRARAVEVAVNALLPWAAAEAAGRGEHDNAERILAVAAPCRWPSATAPSPISAVTCATPVAVRFCRTRLPSKGRWRC
ncbi:MAG: hypothetical protein U0531_15855 [Dehalococcoidia bacterium]